MPYRFSICALTLILVVASGQQCVVTPVNNLTDPGGQTQPGTPPGTTNPGGSSGSGGNTGGGSSGGPSNSVDASLLEQVSLERINRARLLPATEARMFNIAIDEGIPGQLNTTPKPAVTMNADLRVAALAHSEDMLDRDYFAHDTPEGVSPFDRMRNAGYLFAAAGENLAWRGTTGTLDIVQTVDDQHEDLFVDEGIPDRGHRVTMLNAIYREVGIAIVTGAFTRDDGVVFTSSMMQTQDFGTDPANPTFVLGVVYNDTNGNGQYDYNEGRTGVTVQLGNVQRTTNSAGGYSFRVNTAGTYTLLFSGGATRSLTIEDGDPNIKVDLIDGTRLEVNLGLGLLE